MPFSFLPPEILDAVFLYLLEGRRWYDIKPQQAYHPLLLVNHHWHNVALRHLYHAVAANDHTKSQSLLETLENYPSLCTLVRGVHLGTLTFHSQDSSLIHSKIISKCLNIEKIWVTGWGGFLNTLMESMKAAPNLDEILLSRSDGSDDLVLCQSRRFIENLPTWPRLRRLSLYGPVLCDDNDEFRLRTRLLHQVWNIEGTFFDEGTTIPMNEDLREVRFMENAISFTEHSTLPNLAILAPRVEVLSIHYRNWHAQLHAPHLKTSLKRWSSQLTELHLTSSGGYVTSSMPPLRPSIDDIFLQLEALRVVDISSFFVLLHTLVRTTAPVEQLFFWDHLRTGDIICNELGQYLEDESVLPLLRLLQTRRCDPPQNHPIRSVCRFRGVIFNPLTPSQTVGPIEEVMSDIAMAVDIHY